MLNKKNRNIFLYLLIFSLLSISTIYAISNKDTYKETANEIDDERCEDTQTYGSLQAPANIASDEGIEIKLDGRRFILNEEEYLYKDERLITLKKDQGKRDEIIPIQSISWPDEIITYNTRKHFTRPGGDTFVIRKDTTVVFSYKIKYQNCHFETGIMDENYNTLEIFSKRNGAGGYYRFSPEKDVEGYFYIWNKSAEAIEIEQISFIH